MIRKSGNRFFEKIMLQEYVKVTIDSSDRHWPPGASGGAKIFSR